MLTVLRYEITKQVTNQVHHLLMLTHPASDAGGQEHPGGARRQAAQGVEAQRRLLGEPLDAFATLLPTLLESSKATFRTQLVASCLG